MRGGFLFICLCFGREGRGGMGWGGEEPISFMVGVVFSHAWRLKEREEEGVGGGGRKRTRGREKDVDKEKERGASIKRMDAH